MTIENLNVGIVGLGFVGDAILNAINDANYKLTNTTHPNSTPVSCYTFDINPNTNPTCETLGDLVDLSDIIFVCVPTPLRKSDHSCDTSIVEQVIKDIDALASEHKLIVIKSTVPVGTTDRLQDKYANHSIVFNPEFLTEANYREDYKNGEIIIGKPFRTSIIMAEVALDIQMKILQHASYRSFKNWKIVTAREAELFKYVANLFLAVKVSFANEMQSVAAEVGVNWSSIQQLAINDERLGKTHWAVPGPDGRRGFGGTCFPKDMGAFIQFAHSISVPVPILETVWKRNTIVDRPERDWERLEGRSVVS
jgi:UDPglucose 6-dehydrogenase